MAKSKQFLVFILLLSILKISESDSLTGLTLKMVHRDSVESPIYPGNLTSQEKFQRHIEISKNRVALLTSNTKMEPDFVFMHPPISLGWYMYMVKLQIGTPPKDSWLLLDTGSSLIWVQCEPCEPCYKQTYPIYDPKKSSTYEILPCDRAEDLFPECRCVDTCKYETSYGDESITRGIASIDRFTFEPDKSRVSHLAFGCSTYTSESVYTNITGILGLDMKSRSFIMQIGLYFQYRFSYCLVHPLISTVNSYLKFGVDAGYIGGDVKTTPFDIVTTSSAYYLKLLDISISGKRMGFPAGTFDVTSTGEGGVVIDSGTIVSFFDPNVYEVLKMEFNHYFSGFGLQRYPACPLTEVLCYVLPDDFSSFPNVTYHFQAKSHSKNADMFIQPENVFLIDRDAKFFSLAMAPKGKRNIIGTWNQHNTRFVYDIGDQTLSFVPENCAEDDNKLN